MTDKKSRGRPEQVARTDDLYPAMQRRSDGNPVHMPKTEDEEPSGEDMSDPRNDKGDLR